jgi:galactokinase
MSTRILSRPRGARSPAPGLTADAEALRRAFHDLHGREPRLFRAPGRVNLIGEHIDYHDGFVLPLAMDRGTLVAASARPDRRLRIRSVDAGEDRELDLDAPPIERRGDWLDYVEGVARELEAGVGPLRGADLLVHGDVPVGAGLSSSASLEVALALALLSLSGRRAGQRRIARLCQAAEHRFVGTRCGIMDQLTAACGRAGHALLIDCRSLRTTAIPLPAERAAVLVCHSGVRHRLATSGYNDRRAESEAALRKVAPGRPTLREVRAAEIGRARLDPVLERRARHVVHEIARTRRAARALRDDDLDAFGALMVDSHRSLRDDYEVSTPELDVLVEAALDQPGVYGSRMTGGGFGGCTVTVVRPEAAAAAGAAVAAAFESRFGRTPLWFVTAAADGARELAAEAD